MPVQRVPISAVTTLNSLCVRSSHSHASSDLSLKIIIPAESQTLKSLSCQKTKLSHKPAY